jgi:hypothetical protein
MMARLKGVYNTVQTTVFRPVLYFAMDRMAFSRTHLAQSREDRIPPVGLSDLFAIG